jgi:hypothetical protein
MANKTPWGWIIFGIVAFTMIVGVSLIAVAGFVIYQQFAFKSVPVTARSAELQFEDIAKRFEGQKPLIVIEEGEPQLRTEHAERRPGTVNALHVMVWDRDSQRVVSLNIPFWLIRMTNGHPIKLSSSRSDRNEDDEEDEGDDEGNRKAPRLTITARDLERFGPGLILLHRDPDGERIVVWAE